MKALLIAPMGSVHRRFNKANIQALLDLGYEVHLLANFNNGNGTEAQNEKYSTECAKQDIIVHSMPFNRASIVKNLKYVNDIKDLLKKYNFDIVHAHTETGGLLLRLASSAKGNSSFVYTPHGMSFYKGSSLLSQVLYRPIEKWICKAMNANLAMNVEELHVLNQWNPKTSFYVHGIGLNLSPFKSNTILNNINIREEFKIPQNGYLILSVGELNANKNHEVVLRALSRIDTSNLYYVICGIGQNHNNLVKLVGELHLQSHVILAGYRNDIPEVVKQCNLFIFPSYHEGLPVSVMEAMAGGLPVICSKIRGNVDLIHNGINGYVFDPDDDITLSKYILDLVNDKAKVARMQSQNIHDINVFSYDVVMNELRDIYTSVK